MKLHELDAQRQTERVAKVFESHHGQRINFGALSVKKAQSMLNRVRGLIREHRSAPSFHYSERNPDYMKLVMMEQALSSRIAEMGEAPVAIDVNDPKTKAVLDKAAKGVNLSPDEQKTVAAVANMKKEAAKPKRMVAESELQQAQVVMAAQDLVDRLQGMLEDVSEMQFKDVPALTDSIRNDMGLEQAQQFQADTTAALTALLQAIQTGKTQMEAAQGVLTGQAPVVPGEADLGAEPGVDASLDLDVDAELPAAGEEEDEEETEVVGLGRERR